MEAIVKEKDALNKQVAMQALFSYLDKGIDDMEAGKVHTVGEAFQIIKEKIESEL